MRVNYRIIVKGSKPGHAERQVQDAIIGLLEGDPEILRERVKLDGSFAFRMPDLETAREWSAKLDALGCLNAIDPDPDRAVAAADYADFTRVKLRPYISTGFGLIFNAPESWLDTSSEDFFQVTDPATDAQFTASGVEAADATLQQWADFRFGVVSESMGYLKPVRAPAPLAGNGWSGLCAEYRGVFPGNEAPSHYLVLCLFKNGKGVSFTLTAPVQAFEAHEAFFRWLIEHQLTQAEVRRAGVAGEPPAAAAAKAPPPARKKSRLFYWIVGGLLLALIPLLQWQQRWSGKPQDVPLAPYEAQGAWPKREHPCWAVGVWEVTWNDRVLAHTTLKPDGSFSGELKYDSPDGPHFDGRWGVGWHARNEAMYWENKTPKLHDEVNDLARSEDGGFYLQEKGDNRTRWRRIQEIACQTGKAAEGGPVIAPASAPEPVVEPREKAFFRGVLRGMTLKQVRAAFPEARKPARSSDGAQPPALQIDALDFHGFPFSVKFYFGAGGLDRISLASVHTQDMNAEQAQPILAGIRSEFDAAYGKPVIENYYTHSREAYDMNMVWETADTSVELREVSAPQSMFNIDIGARSAE